MKRSAVELAEDAARLEDPRQGLAAITELRRRLEDLEARHVRTAIRAGLSWSQVAERLEVSKQAAHKKHADSVRGAGEAAARANGEESAVEARRRGRNVRLDA